MYETAATDSFVSIEKAERVLGFAPKYSNKDALIRNYQWYLDNRHRFAGQSGVTHRVPWKQGILGRWPSAGSVDRYARSLRRARSPGGADDGSHDSHGAAASGP